MYTEVKLIKQENAKNRNKEICFQTKTTLDTFWRKQFQIETATKPAACFMSEQCQLTYV